MLKIKGVRREFMNKIILESKFLPTYLQSKNVINKFVNGASVFPIILHVRHAKNNSVILHINYFIMNSLLYKSFIMYVCSLPLHCWFPSLNIF